MFNFWSGKGQFLKHLPFNVFAFFFVVATFCFGPGYQPLAFLFMPGILFLVGYTRSAPSGWMIPLMIFPAMTIGIFFGYAGSFTSTWPFSSFDTVYMIPVAAIYAFLISLILLLDRAIAGFSMMMLHFLEVFFIFPMLWAGLWVFLARLSPFGDFGNWGYALALMGLDDLTLGVTWTAGAIPGGAFVFGMIISSILYLMRRFLEIYYPEDIPAPPSDFEPSVSKKQLMSDRTDIRLFFFHPIAFVVYIFALTYSFGNIYSNFAPTPRMFYEAPLQYFAPEKVHFSCLVNGSLNSTVEHLSYGGVKPKFIIWSEASVNVYDQPAFLESAMGISEKYSVYLGLSYKLFFNMSSQAKYDSTSVFTLIVPPSSNGTKASVGFSYQKAKVVPGLEDKVKPSDEKYVPYIDTPYGRIGAAIGMDFNFHSIEDAYANKVSIMIQPVWNWGTTGILHAQMNRLRAVENGFTLFRCAKNGVSGVYDPFYRVLSEQITLGTDDGFTYGIPLLGTHWTLYSLMFDYLGIICMSVLCFWIFFVVYYGIKQVRASRHPRVRRAEAITI